MANEWRKLALTVPETLLQACTTDEALRLIDLATAKLKAQQEALRSYRVGAADGYVVPGPAGVSPTTLLEDARREIKRCSTLHGLADNALPLCFEGMGLVLGGEMVESWATHSSDALRNADEAQLSLRNGVTFAHAAIDALAVAAALPAGVIVQTAWLLAAEQLQGNAINEVHLARDHLREMRGELSLQFIDAESIVHLDLA